jgi:RHS repeat-associated protein
VPHISRLWYSVAVLIVFVSAGLRADGPTYVRGSVRSDLATTYPYSDDPLAPRTTRAKRQHILELRTAINTVRQQAGLLTFQWTDTTPVVIRAIHVSELRQALAEALAALKRPVPQWSSGVTAGGVLKAVHLDEIRAATRWEASGTVASNATWTAAGSPYVVSGEVAVSNGATLTIAPGTVVKFNPGAGIQVYGSSTLVANGTSTNPIVFTSIKDDSAGGDTNRDGTATVPAPGDWRGVGFGGGTQAGHGSITHATVRYGAQLTVQYSAPTLRYLTSRDMSLYGLYIEAPPAGYVVERVRLENNDRNLQLYNVPASVVIRDSVITGARTIAIQAAGGSAAQLVNNSIDNNDGDGAIITDGSAPIVLRYNSITNNRNAQGVARGIRATSCCITVDARENWWGSTTGPEIEGDPESGGGGQISSNVTYDPWLGKPWAGAFKMGDHPWTLKAGVGVDVTTGNFYMQEHDFSIPTVGFPLEITRTYNSKAAGTVLNEFGVGWLWNYGTRLYTTSDAHGVVWHREDGAMTYFKRNPNDTFSSEEGVYEKLVWNPGSASYLLVAKNQSSLTFSSDGKLTYQTDASGNTTTINRDQAGRITSIVEPKGRALTFEYDGQYIRRITDPLGLTYTYQRNPNGAIASLVKQEAGTAFAWANYYYGAGGPWEMIGFKDADGNGLEQEFDLAQRVVTQRFNSNSPVRFAYGPTSANGFEVGEYVTMVWDSRGRAHAYFFTPSNKVVAHDRQHVTAEGWTWMREDTWAYTSYLTSAYTNPDGTTQSTYDWRTGNVTKVIEPGGRTTSYAYDEFNNVTSTTDHLNRTTRYEYDSKQRLTKATDALGNVSRTEYYSDGLRLFEIDAYDRITVFHYDPFGYPRAVTNPENETTRYTYDASGRKLNEENHLGERTSYFYNGRGDILDVTDPLGNRTTFGYDLFGRKTRATDAENRTTRYEYNDATNMLVRTIDAREGVVELTRDTFGGNIIEVKDPNQHITRFSYDDLNRRISETDALNRTWRYEYVGRDRLWRTTDPAGAVTRVEYDSANQVSHVFYPDGRSVQLLYDGVGNRTQLTDWLGSTTWVFDPLNRIVHVGKGSTFTGYVYDKVGNLKELTYAAGKTVYYGYDAADRLRTVTDWTGRVTTYTYDDAGREIGCAYPNGVEGRRTYDASARNATITYARGATVFASAGYAYDRVGNRLSRRYADERFERYSYDELHRLSQVTYPDGRHENFTYDPGGNRLSRYDSRNGFTNFYAYDAADQMLNDDFGSRSYTPRGELASDGRPRTFVWNGQGFLQTVIDPFTTTQYVYDGEGRRVRHSSYGTTTDQVVDSVSELSRVLSETANGLTTYFIYGQDLIYALKGGTTPYFHHADALGSTIAVTRADGTLDGTFNYDAFGRGRDASYNEWTRRQFTGEEVDRNELLYLRARYYDPLSGRFLSRDPFPMDESDTQSVNRYAYVKNNPLRYVDPSGEYLESIVDLILIAYDLIDIAQTILRGDQISSTQRLALGADIFGLAAPGFTGGGVMVRASARGANNAADGYRSFSAFKAANGPAGRNMDWHHIVEQTPGNVSRFGAEAIHNTRNIVAVPSSVHRGKGSISGRYSSIQPFTGGVTVRRWLAGQSFERQYNFGMRTLNKFMRR